ncbi:MAG TPA: SIMPL domain-containing protein [Bryobacteraceae bacterium]|jgi:hypothetical protein|nr:SIMPL domain-containing protein [Bryobacteraceae bacterium]
MRISCLVALLVTCAALGFGQLDSETVTIQASRSVSLTPDQVVLTVSVSAGPTTSLDQIVAALANSGITAANFVRVTSGRDTLSPLQWSFRLAVPLGKIKATIASLTALQQSIAQSNSGIALSFQVQGSQVSSDLVQSQACAAKDLVADAQTQAQSVAAAAGLAIGPIVAISDGSSSAATPTFVRAGDFFVGNSIYTTGLWFDPTPPGCYIEVKFKLLRYQ